MIGDWFFKGFYNTVADIRQRVFEEPTYNKIVTPRTQNILLNGAERAAGEQSPAERLGWDVQGQQCKSADSKAQDPSIHERGIDR